MKTSVASVTFRNRTVEQVAELARRAGLDAIEWGGDIHLPPGDRQAIERVRQSTRQNGLEISAYGSYYRAGEEDFAPVLQTALAVDCRLIRVWAGRQASGQCTPEQRQLVVNNLRRAVEQAAEAGCVVATEYHANTLTDTLDSALQLLADVPGLHTFWQPPVGLSLAENMQALQALTGKIESLHVYHRSVQGECRPLSEGAENWRAYFRAALQDGLQHYATLEFVKDGTEEQFLQDAAALHLLFEEVQG